MKYLLTLPILAIIAAGCGGSSSSGPSSGSSSVTLTGAGSTFDLPFFSKAFAAYSGANHNLSVNYQPIGSGAGIEQFTKGTIDFGATDVPMNSTELAAAKSSRGTVVQVPVALGGVSVAYSLPGIKSGLRLDGSTIADIYLGTIINWNDPRIAVLNPGMKLPNLRITPVHRSDASDTSYIFTNYLSDVSPTWTGRVGTGKLPNWPAGVGGKGNPGVAQVVQSTPGAIGYVELAYVIQNHMTEARVKNRAGAYVYPTQATVASAAATFPHVSAQNFSIDNATGAQSYPICGYSWALLPGSARSTKGKDMVQMFRWLTTSGQQYAAQLDYVPLPANVQATAKQDLGTIQT